MKITVFDLYGKFAHFRKFYTNSSSLTYLIPPRTTIEGIIAALLGYERDSYYDVLSVDKLNIAVKKRWGGKQKKDNAIIKLYESRQFEQIKFSNRTHPNSL